MICIPRAWQWCALSPGGSPVQAAAQTERVAAGAAAARRAMTLLEVTISLALVSLLLGSLLTFFWQTLQIRDRAAQTVARNQVAQRMLEQIANELRDAVGVEQVGFPNLTVFRGERRKVTFLTAPLPTAEAYAFYQASAGAPVLKHDLREVTYQLWVDPEKETEDGNPVVGGIVRTERQALDPVQTEADVPEGEDLLWMRHDLCSYELGYLEFRYFDGVEWTTTWEVQEGNPLPHLVQITVGFDSLTRDELDDLDLEKWPLDQYPLGPDQELPERYSTIVRLPAADELFSARWHRLLGEAEEVYEFGKPADEGTEGSP